MQNESPSPPPWPESPRYLPVPECFHSLEHSGPFRKCLVCDGKLLDPDTGYLVERIFRGNEPIVEYAICQICQCSVSSELSQSSQLKLMEIFGAVDMEARLERLANHVDEFDADPWLEECYLTGKRRHECRGYQIVGRFFGPSMELTLFPIMLSDDAVQMITGQLSKQTRDRLDDFMDNFTMPPEFAADPDFTPVFL